MSPTFIASTKEVMSWGVFVCLSVFVINPKTDEHIFMNLFHAGRTWSKNLDHTSDKKKFKFSTWWGCALSDCFLVIV